MAAATEPDIPPTPSQTLYSVTTALEEHDEADVERIIRAVAAYFGVELVELVEHTEVPR